MFPTVGTYTSATRESRTKMINTITPQVVDGEMRLLLTVLSGQVLSRGGSSFVFDPETIQLPEKALLDYNHDDDQIIGYCKDFYVDGAAVYCEAVLVARPDDPGARANEVIANIAHGAPYEVSPLVDLSQATQVDRLDGALSYHNAILRGVAICPHGTDADTAFVAFGSGVESFPGSPLPLVAPCVREPANERAEAVFSSQIQQSASKGIDMPDEKNKEEEIIADGQEPVEEEQEKEPRNLELSQMLDEFGRERGLDFYLEGLSLEEARAKDYEELKNLRAETEQEKEPDPQEEPTQTEEEEERQKEIQQLKASVSKLESKLVALSALVKRGDPGVAASHDPDEAREKKPKNALLRAALKYKEMGTKKLV